MIGWEWIWTGLAVLVALVVGVVLLVRWRRRVRRTAAGTAAL